MELEKLIDNLSKQAWINVYRRNILLDAKTKSGVHFKFVENDTSLSSVFAYDGRFVRIEVDSAKKAVRSVEIVEYTPCTTMQWVETAEKRHWCNGENRMYRNMVNGATYQVLCESECANTGIELITYRRADVLCDTAKTVPAKTFFERSVNGEPVHKLIRELML